MRAVGIPTAGVLIGIAALHVGWGAGSSFPYSGRHVLADSVAGTQDVPGRRYCFFGAGLLACAAGMVADVEPIGITMRWAGLPGVAAILRGRGAAGVAGRTASILPRTPSARFVELDRRYYGPMCLHAAGTLLSAS